MFFVIFGYFYLKLYVLLQKKGKNNEKHEKSPNFEKQYFHDKTSYEDGRHGILKVRKYTFCENHL